MAHKLNAEQASEQNAIFIERDPHREFKKGTAMAPHETGFYVWPGQELLGCRRDTASVQKDIVNGCSYSVLHVSDQTVVLRLIASGPEEDLPVITLTHHMCIQYCRLACAQAHAAVQGLTLRDQRLLLCDLFSDKMDARKPHVGLSRATSSENIRVPSYHQRRELFGAFGGPTNAMEQ